MAEGNGWNEHQRLVLDKLDGHGDQLEKLWVEMRRLSESIVEVKTKSSLTATVISIFGAAIGIVGAYIAAAAKHMRNP